MELQLSSAQLRRAADLKDRIEALQKQFDGMFGALAVSAPAAAPAAAPVRRRRRRAARRLTAKVLKAKVAKLVKAAKAAKPGGRVGGTKPTQSASPGRKAKKATRRLSTQSTAGAVREVLKSAGKPLEIGAIIQGLEARGRKFVGKTARTNLGIQLYRMAGVEKVGRGVFKFKA